MSEWRDIEVTPPPKDGKFYVFADKWEEDDPICLRWDAASGEDGIWESSERDNSRSDESLNRIYTHWMPFTHLNRGKKMTDELNIDAAAEVIFQGKWVDALKLSELDFSHDYFKRIQESAIYDISHMRYVAKKACEAALAPDANDDAHNTHQALIDALEKAKPYLEREWTVNGYGESSPIYNVLQEIEAAILAAKG